MKTREYAVQSMSNVEELRDLLLDTYSRVEVLNCVSTIAAVIVTVAVGY